MFFAEYRSSVNFLFGAWPSCASIYVRYDVDFANLAESGGFLERLGRRFHDESTAYLPVSAAPMRRLRYRDRIDTGNTDTRLAKTFTVK